MEAMSRLVQELNGDEAKAANAAIGAGFAYGIAAIGTVLAATARPSRGSQCGTTPGRRAVGAGASGCSG